jgi:cardiolipin synthase
LRSVRREYLLRIREARERIDIANAYFVPDLRVLRALLEARRRGVRVRVVVPEHADVPLIKHAVEATFDVLLRHGVEVYALPRPMLHAKTALVDDHFVTIGSYNLDHRSWRKNLELNIAVLSTEFAADVRLSLERDIALAQAVTLESWRRRPLLRRGLEWVTRRMQDLW